MTTTPNPTAGDPPLHARFAALVAQGDDQLPLPGAGQTLARWRALAAVAREDLALAKWFEGHTDALAILQELDGPVPPRGARLGMWAAEAPGGRVSFVRQADGAVELRGTKQWCSGAEHVTHGLLTAWEDGRGDHPWLVLVDMRLPTVQTEPGHWHAAGMGRSRSVDVRFEGTPARIWPRAGEYLTRPGFWQGGAGVAACWYGGCVGVAAALQQAASRAEPQGADGRTRLAALGRADALLQPLAALLRATAQWIDRHPADDARVPALRLRMAADSAARQLLDLAGPALGAGPLCRDARLANLVADLPVFVRQTHGDRDFAALGDDVRRDAAPSSPGLPEPWTL
ncbi:acyl-CoA dehydrogenase [Aquincola sp. MAHUQ-54]|uniref:Acyl-CoA dehydrogenase n=1 Tax=Aquincola agrisoli TaxID=3119538 RepID=A0AAW9QG23_9BURK